MTDTTQHISQLIIKHLRGELTPGEEIELMKALDASENVTQTFNHLTDADRLKEELALRYRFNKEAGFKRLQERINAPRRSKIAYLKEYYVAAGLLLLIAAGIFFINRKPYQPASTSAAVTNPQSNAIKPGGPKATLLLSDGTTLQLDEHQQGRLAQQGAAEVIKQSDNSLQYLVTGKSNASLYNTLTTPNGGMYELILPDGSKAVLNAGSSIRYPVSFSDTLRQVTFTGEVYFDVTDLLYNSKKVPFRADIVTALGTPREKLRGIIEVMGTQFNVQAYDTEPVMKTTLLDGSVKIRNTGSATRELKPGQQALFEDRGAIKISDTEDPAQQTAWINGMFHFADENITTVMQQLARWYDVEIVYKSPIPPYTVTTAFPNSYTLEKAVDMIRLTNQDVQFNIEERKVTLSMKY